MFPSTQNSYISIEQEVCFLTQHLFLKYENKVYTHHTVEYTEKRHQTGFSPKR